MSVDPAETSARVASDAAMGASRRTAPAARLDRSVRPASGKPCAVPVRDFPATSGWLAEGSYRGLEILIAIVGLVVGLPFLLAAAVLVRCDSPGPAMFFHRRVARSAIARGRDLIHRSDLRPPPGGYDPDALYYVPRYFTFPKLRTMYSDARARFPALYDYQFAPGEFHKQYAHTHSDPRITRAGRILRKLSVDELPNLWSVLRGDVGLVGPRPESPDVLQHYTPDEMYKFACKPGITGLAQVNGRGLLNWGKTIEWDLRYVHTRSVMLDLKILLTTLIHLVGRRGAF